MKAHHALFVFALFAGCSSENIGASSEATTSTNLTTHSKYVRNTTPTLQNNEPSCTWSPPKGADRNGIWVCGFNDSNGDPVANMMGWSFSTDGINWTYCNPTMPSCGSTPMAPGQTAWGGDPYLVADGKGNVAYISLANPVGGTNYDTTIVAALSSDGGKSFTQTVLVNDNIAPSPQYPCAAAAEDEPAADVDITTDTNFARKLSVVWRHNGAGPGNTWGACIRRGLLCGVGETDPACSGVVTRPGVAWEMGAGNGISNFDRDNSLAGQSGLIVQAGDGAVAVVAPNCDVSMVNCPDTSVHTCTWERVLSYDGGQTWSGNVHIDTTSSMQNCVVNGSSPPNGGRVEARHRGTFAFARDRRNGDYYVATTHGKADLRLFRSQNQGATWTQVRQFSNPSVPTITLPTLAADSAGRLALTYIQSDPTDATVEAVFATVASVPTGSNPDPPPDPNNWAFTALTSFFNPSPGNQVRVVGDYNTIAVLDPIVNNVCLTTSRFQPAWTDTLNPSPADFMVHTTEMDVTP